MECKRCGGNHCVKSGYICGNQRYKCKDYSYNFESTNYRYKNVTLQNNSMDKTVYKKCDSDNCIKNDKVRNQQRYKSKKCGCNFIEGDRREKFTPVTKALSILLYGRGKANYSFIAKLFNVRSVAVMKLLKRESDKMPEPEINSSIKEVSFDEMWHFVNKKKKIMGMAGSGVQ